MKERVLENFRREPQGFLEKMGVHNLRYGSIEAKGCCPLHEERNPSFSINLTTGLWICFSGCGKGDLFTLYKEIHSYTDGFFQQLKKMEDL